MANPTYNGHSFAVPRGSEEWQDGYRDGLLHAGQGVAFLLEYQIQERREYAAGYRAAMRDHEDWCLQQQENA